MRAFVRSDYYGYGGAESFRDGTPPQIGTVTIEGKAYDLIAAHNHDGVSISVMGDNDDNGFAELALVIAGNYSSGLAILIASALESDTTLTRAKLEEMGFISM